VQRGDRAKRLSLKGGEGKKKKKVRMGEKVGRGFLGGGSEVWWDKNLENWERRKEI